MTSPRFTRDEEARLAAVMRGGGPAGREAADLLARSVLPWACKVALQQAARHGLDREEAESLAYYAVARCLARFDPDRGRLTTLVGQSVPRMVKHQADRWRGPVAVPQYVFHPPAGVKVPAERKRAAAKAQQRVGELDQFGRPVVGQLLDSRGGDPAEELLAEEDRRELSARMEWALSLLSDRERRVVERRVLGGALLREVGEELGVTKEAVRQIEAKALKSLRRYLESPDA